MENEVLIKNNEAFVIKDGTLVKLGTAVELKHIIHNTFESENGIIYIINGLNVSGLSGHFRPMRIGNMEKGIPKRTKSFQKDFVAAFDCQATNTRVYQRYQKISAEFSKEELENMQHNAVVLSCKENLHLYRMKNGNQVEQKDIISLDFHAPAFIYHGGLYAQNTDWYNDNVYYAPVPFKPLIIKERYLIFWGGRDNLFALVEEKDGIKFRVLGSLHQYFETEHGMVIEVETKRYEYALYNLGKNLDYIFTRTCSEDFDLDTKTGRISYYGKIRDMHFAFKKGHYVQI